MISWLGRHGLVALLVMALVGLSAARTLPSGIGVGHASAAMDRVPCDQDIKDVGSKDDTHGKGMTTSCALGFACASANFVAGDIYNSRKDCVPLRRRLARIRTCRRIGRGARSQASY
jgi:hypothetical protein